MCGPLALISIPSRDPASQTDVELKATSANICPLLSPEHANLSICPRCSVLHVCQTEAADAAAASSPSRERDTNCEGLLLDARVTHPLLDSRSSPQTKGHPRFEAALKAAARVHGRAALDTSQKLKH